MSNERYRLLRLVVVGVVVGLSGCEVMQGTAIAPRVLVEGCIAEAYPASHEGWGVNCAALNEWMKLHAWAYGGGPVAAPVLSEAERRALVVK